MKHMYCKYNTCTVSEDNVLQVQHIVVVVVNFIKHQNRAITGEQLHVL